MKEEMKFALYAIKMNIRSNAENRISFWLNVFGMMLTNITFVIMWSSMAMVVGKIGGWEVIDVVGLNAYAAGAFGIVTGFGGGLFSLFQYINDGTLDRYILSPKNLIMRISTSKFVPSALGDLIYGVVSLIIFLIYINASIFQILMSMILLILSSLIFFSFNLLSQAIAFYFVDSREVVRGVSEIFFTPALYHGGAIQGGLRFVFTFIVPSLVLATLPVEIIRSFDASKFVAVIIIVMIFMYVSYKFFYFSLRKYESGNSIGFGD